MAKDIDSNTVFMGGILEECFADYRIISRVIDELDKTRDTPDAPEMQIIENKDADLRPGIGATKAGAFHAA